MSTTIQCEHCKIEDIFKVKSELPAGWREAIEKHLADFAKPDEEAKCLKCGTVQGGLMGALMGGFTYGIAHGEGHCGTCGWPARANHYFKDAEGKDIGSMQIILQYHPDLVSEETPCQS